MSDNRNLQQEITTLNDLSTGELGRLIRLHVERVSREIPEVVLTRRRRHIAPRIIELTKQDARTLINILQHGLDMDLPGTISFTAFGREEL